MHNFVNYQSGNVYNFNNTSDDTYAIIRKTPTSRSLLKERHGTDMNRIRFASPYDALEILKIYSPFIKMTAFTFECDVPKPYEMKRRISSVGSRFPWLICEINGETAGYAFATSGKQKGAYRWNAEVAVYIKEDYRRCNIASALYYAVIELLKLQGYYNVIAYITIPNESSEHFHRAFGFVKSGELSYVGYKLGKWYSVAIYEKQLRPITENDAEPLPVKAITEIEESDSEHIFTNALKIVRFTKA